MFKKLLRRLLPTQEERASMSVLKFIGLLVLIGMLWSALMALLFAVGAGIGALVAWWQGWNIGWGVLIGGFGLPLLVQGAIAFVEWLMDSLDQAKRIKQRLSGKRCVQCGTKNLGPSADLCQSCADAAC